MSAPQAAQLSDADRQLLAEFREGNRRALARLITRVDNGEDVAAFLDGLEADKVAATNIIGITGPPGAGKSTLIGALIPEFRRRDKSVAIVAVDPDSPFTGGAILGDRIRMGQHVAHDDGVYIRSISSRGSPGGVSRSARSICRLLTAFGFDYVLLETVGAGQAELMIMDAADIVMLVLVPGTGDAIQWEKAGQVEIADVFALNKADLPGIDALENGLRQSIEHAAQPIIRTIANAEGEQSSGMGELYGALMENLERAGRGELARRSPVARRLRAGLEDEFSRRLRALEQQPLFFAEFAAAIGRGEQTLEQAVAAAWARLAQNGKA